MCRVLLYIFIIFNSYMYINAEQMKKENLPPIAKKHSKTIRNFNDKRIDDYDWLRDINYPKVTNKEILSYLEAENNFAKYELSKSNKLIKDIYEEIKSRISEDDKTVPIKNDDYFYYSYINKGMEYWVHARRYKTMKNREEIILDENKLAKGLDYFRIAEIKVSSNNKLMTYAVDTQGNEIFEINIKDLRQNKLLVDKIPNTFESIVWHENNKGFFYIPVSENWRAKKVYYHKLDTDYKNDKLLYEEKDNTYSVNISKSNSKKYLIIYAESKAENECYYIDLSNNILELKLFFPRKSGHLYSISDHNNKFYILTNDKGKNFRIAVADKRNIIKKWEDFIPYSNDRYIRNFELYKNHIVITNSNNKNGLIDIKIINLKNNLSKKLKFLDDTYQVDIVFTNYKANNFRFYYSSLKTPRTLKEYNFNTNKEQTLKIDKIPSGFNSNQYKIERIYAKSRDRKNIPISLIYKKDKFKADRSNPLYLYAYGSYGYSIPLTFRKSIFSLVDRGFVYAIAHIRGGDDLGYKWYESAKFLTKKHTFYDFIDSVKHLIRQGYTKRSEITIAGGSAGGMVIGFSINEEPGLFKIAVAHVPFVDVLNTMLDENLPLTSGEFKEWGNPKDKQYYDYIKSYSPYDNIKKQSYPNLFVTTGLNDPRVTYWEAAKWIAKLREYKIDNNTIIFKTNMHAGHAGKSGRYTYLWEIAEEYAFVISKTYKE